MVNKALGHILKIYINQFYFNDNTTASYDSSLNVFDDGAVLLFF
jgi:hypothetical protein